MGLRIASYNMHDLTVSILLSNVKILQTVRHILKREDNDIIALQGIWCRYDTWAAAFAVAGWQLVRPQRESHILGFFGSGLAIAFRPSQWTLTDSRFYPFLASAFPDTTAVKGWFRVVLTGFKEKSVTIINTHLQSDFSIETRQAQMQQLLLHNKEHPADHIVGELYAEE